jgi:Xaa-Pro aminopeptidase
VTAFIPTFTEGERDRRWARVRQRMAAEKLDCLIAFPNQGRFEQLQANTRYLTQIGGFATEVALVFPLEQDVTAFVQSEGDVEFWSVAQNWIKDVRCSRRVWSRAMIARLQEFPFKRVGVIGLKGLMRAPEGVVPWTMFENVKQAFPNTEFVNATHITLEARAVKSAEEIGFMQKAEEIAEAAVDAMFKIARCGVRENELFAEMLGTMVRNGGELPTMLYWDCGQPGYRHLVPTPIPLAAGDVIANEIEGKYAGYVAQIGAPAIVGPIRDETYKTYEAAANLFESLCKVIRAGRKLPDVGRDYVEMVKGMGYQPAAWPLHGRGLGDDLPIMQNALAETDAVFEEGHVLIFKPGMIAPDDPSDSNERVGDTVVVTKDGARRLGKRSLGITSIPL